jgi:serine/threonine-protein kinase
MKKLISLDKGNQFSFTVDDPILTDEGQQVEIGEWLGRGGNSVVYGCTDAATGEQFAVKFLMMGSRKAAVRFAREGTLLKALDNIHIVKYRGGGSVRSLVSGKKKTKAFINVPFIVMDLAEQNLGGIMAERGKAFKFEDYAGQFRGLSGALAALHMRAIHRDIKPENILISGDRWLLSDYGLCSFVDAELTDLTGEHERVGPKYWLSPEAQNRMLRCGDTVSTASDVFQLAAVFWFVATGRYPLGIVTNQDWKGPEKLFEVLRSSLMHDPSERPKDGTALLAAIEESLNA